MLFLRRFYVFGPCAVLLFLAVFTLRFALRLRCVYTMFTLRLQCVYAVFTLRLHYVYGVLTLCSRCVHDVFTMCLKISGEPLRGPLTLLMEDRSFGWIEKTGPVLWVNRSFG